MNKKIVTTIFIVFAAVALGFIYYFFGWTKNERATLQIGNRGWMVEIAQTPASRMRGLSGREKLAENEGMLFVFDAPGRHGFWMKDMKFAIDIVWINQDRVVGFTEEAKPEPERSVFSLTIHYPPEPVTRVLELSAGSVKRYGLKVGDSVYLNSPVPPL